MIKHSEIRNIIREEIKLTFEQEENLFKINPELAAEIYTVISKHLEQTGNSFDLEFGSKVGFFLFLNKNLK